MSAAHETRPRFEGAIARPAPTQPWVRIGVSIMAISVGVMLAGIAVAATKITVLAALPLMIGFVALLGQVGVGERDRGPPDRRRGGTALRWCAARVLGPIW